jgi:carbohydrate kinase (thermoresistant glucokinase family)
MVWIVMGVSGSGKTTIGKKLSGELGVSFYDADDFHPKENVEKMNSGRPLTDLDRKPWLEILSRKICEWNSEDGAVLACSALKKEYRTLLSPEKNRVHFIYLKGTKDLIHERMNQREGHYMPPSLLDSQFEALEEPENATILSVEHSPEVIVHKLLKSLNINR